MKLKKFANNYDLTEDELTNAFIELGFFKSNGEPKNSYIKKGMFSDSGDVLNVEEVTELVEENLNDIKGFIEMKQIEELTNQLEELKEQNNAITEMLETVLEKLETAQFSEPVKKERKKRNIDMSTRARSLIGKKINGWKIEGEKLEVVATKGGKEIRIAGMCKKEDLLEQLK